MTVNNQNAQKRLYFLFTNHKPFFRFSNLEINAVKILKKRPKNLLKIDPYQNKIEFYHNCLFKDIYAFSIGIQ